MSTFENPDAAPGADATPDAVDPALPPVPETPAADAARAAGTTPLDDLTPPAEAARPDDLTPPGGSGDETAVLAELAPPAPAPAPAALPPAFTGFASTAPDAATSTTQVTAAAASTVPAGPRVRWAGIVWGLVLAGIAALALWLLTDASRQVAVTDWMLNLTPAAAIAYAVLVLGGFALIAGLVGLVRRAQRSGERRRAASTLPV